MDKEVICKEVIITTQTCRGSGNVDDPIRRITQVFEKDGTFIAEHDSFRDVQYEDMKSIFKWLLGEDGDFPLRTADEGVFYWRTELRKRLKNII